MVIFGVPLNRTEPFCCRFISVIIGILGMSFTFGFMNVSLTREEINSLKSLILPKQQPTTRTSGPGVIRASKVLMLNFSAKYAVG